MYIRSTYLIGGRLYEEARAYAAASGRYTSNRHDFHAGGLNNKQQKMFEGKLGEKAVKLLFLDNQIRFREDQTPCDERDEYDFLLENERGSLKVDVKTRTENYHIRTLEMVEQAQSHPKDIYISVRLYRNTSRVRLLGWFTYQDMIRKNQIENQGYLNNYVMYDRDLRPISELCDTVLKQFQTRH